MMENLEKILFDVNEGLHRSGLFPDDKYITPENVFISIVLTAIFMPLMLNAIDYLFDNMNENGYLTNLLFAMMTLLLYILDGLMPVLLVMFMIGVVSIIYKYPQYSKIREYIDRLF